MQKSRAFVFTLNNYTNEDEIRVQNIKCNYLIYGREIAPSTGTPHLQGYVRFENARHFKSVKKEFTNETHLETAKGSIDQNIKYTSKESNVFEKGDRPLSTEDQAQHQKKLFKDAREAAKEGRFEDIDDSIYIRYRSSLHAIARDAYICPEDCNDVTGVWIYGASGAGKSRLARERYPNAYMKCPTSKWWDGYINQEHVIIDDFDKYMKGQAYWIKIWADRYSFPAESKGSSAMIRPKVICITSQYHPCDIWDDNETLEAIRRRFKMIYIVEGQIENNPTYPNE
jgi:hypothetical protein